MWLIIGLVAGAALLALGLWLRHLWIMDTLRFYGAYGAMAGMYAYKKYGIWHLGYRYTKK